MDLDLQPSPSSDISATLAGSTFVKSRQNIILEEAEVQETPTAGSLFNKGLSFWMIFLAICLSLFLFALDLVSRLGEKKSAWSYTFADCRFNGTSYCHFISQWKGFCLGILCLFLGINFSYSRKWRTI